MSIFVDLDPNAGTLALATSIGAVVVDRMDVTETTGISITASPPLLTRWATSRPGPQDSRECGHIQEDRR